jgi:hypothetical protein
VGIFPARRENSREATSNSGEGLLRLIEWSETNQEIICFRSSADFHSQKFL